MPSGTALGSDVGGGAQRRGLESPGGAIIYTPASRCIVHRAPTHGPFAWPAPPHSLAARAEPASLCGTTWPQNRVPAHGTLLLFMAQLRSHVASPPCVPLARGCWAPEVRGEGGKVPGGLGADVAAPLESIICQNTHFRLSWGDIWGYRG